MPIQIAALQRLPRARETIAVLSCLLAMTCWGAGDRVDDAAGQDMADMSLQELMNVRVETVYSASKYEQKVTRAPASVTIVAAEDIKKFGYRNLADVLRAVPGLYVTDDRNYSYLGVRGFSRAGDFNTRVLLLVDGHRVNDALYGLTYLAQEAVLDVDMIERVEIIRGPASSIYGNSAIFGVINVITRRGSQIDGTEVAAEAGSLHTYKGRVTYGKQFRNDLELTLSGSYYDSAGQQRLYYPEYDAPTTNNGLALNSDNERAGHFFGSLIYQDFTLSAAYSSRYKKVPTAPYGTVFNSGATRTQDDRVYLDLKYEHEFASDLKLSARAAYDRFPYAATLPYPNDAPPPDVVVNQDSSRGRWARTELQLTKRVADRHTLILGTEYQDNLSLRQSNYNVEPYTQFVNVDHRSRNYGLFAQGEFTLSKNVLLNAGVRYDHFESFGGTVNPRVALIYNPWPRSTFKLLYGQAFRAPSDYEVNFQSTNYAANLDLRPETIKTYEGVYEQYLAGHLRLSASAYQYRIRNLISQTTDPASGLLIFDNLDRARMKGLELQLEGRYARGLTARASVALQRAEDEVTGLELSNSPRRLATAALSVPLYAEKLFASLEVQYNGKATTLARETTKDYTLLNLTLLSRQRLLPNLDLALSAYNLLNTAYSTPSSGTGVQDTLRQNGRTWRAQITYKFGR